MTLRIGDHEFDDVSYDADADVLYLSRGEPGAAATVYASPEGHAVRYGEDGAVIGMTIVNAKWISERDGKVTVTMPTQVETAASELASALSAD